ncbi:DsbA family oxidoreductase [Actinomyces culturomici]|uniref:DsbA family oxidoreductase n=1 Tax=Actinomyces culturomici TaxID=1926276 RepID=UPI000E1FBCE4|nr:DsbA family oxidoreductase [Actinomyces culturomici]
MLHIDLWSDVACPWCYLGIRHLREALADFPHADEVEVALHAYLLDPELDSPLEKPRRAYLIEEVGMDVAEAVAADERLVKLGAAEGVAFDFENAIVAPTSNAHRAIGAAADFDVENDTTAGPDTTALKLAEALGRAQFEMALDVSDPDVLVGCAQDIGLPAERVVEALASEEYASRVFSDFQIGVQVGIDLVPTYLFDRRFVVQDHQTVTALGNILATAWENSGKDRA